MDQTWVQSRPHLQNLVAKMQAVLEMADALYARGQRDGDAVDYGAFEAEVSRATAELECAVHETALSGLNIDAPFVRVWGKTYRRAHSSERNFGTMAGTARVHRTLYRQVGLRNGPVLDPVAVRVGAVDGRWLPRTARAIGHLIAQGTSREAAVTSRELCRLPYSRSTFERVGHAVGRQYLRRREPVENTLIERLRVPDEARSISVSVDRTAVPMEEPVPTKLPPVRAKLPPGVASERHAGPGLDARTRATLREQERQARASPPKVARNYRMAYCATVTLHDREGKALHTIRYGRMPPTPGSVESFTHRQVKRLMEGLQRDVVALRAQRPDLPVVLLADGAPELWNLFEEYLNERALGIAPRSLIDAWHALEYVSAACRLLEKHEWAWPGSFRRMKRWLLEEEHGVERVLRALERGGLERVQDENGRRPVGDAIRYLSARKDLMRYAQADRHGFPIGSGAVEATCKSLVSQRMKRSGCRWKPRTGDEVLQLRALQLSDRWEPAMDAVLRPLRKPVHRLSRAEGRAAAA